MSEFGCLRDKFDERDYLIRAYLPVTKLPKKLIILEFQSYEKK